MSTKTTANKGKIKSKSPGGKVAAKAGKPAAAAKKPMVKPVKPAKPAKSAKPASKPASKAPAKKAAKPVGKATAKASPAKPAKKSAAKPDTKNTKKSTAKSSNKAPMTVVKPQAKTAPVKSTKPVKAAKPAKDEKAEKADKKAAATAKTASPKVPEGKAKAEAKPAKTIVAAPTPATPAAPPAKRKGADKPLLVSPAPDVGFRKEYVPVTAGAPTRDFTVKLPPVNAALKDAWKKKAGTELSEPELLAMPDSEYMNESQLAFFKLRLQTMKDDLLKHADETTEHLREDTLTVPDPADRATIEEEHALELRTRDRERKLLKKIQQAIVMIDNGEYGFCEETGEPIGVRRLLARPTANLSLEAQQRREIKQKLYGD